VLDSRRSDCPVSYALEVLGDRWTLLVIRDILFKHKHRYGEFLESEEGMATNILADRLRRLEDAGMIARTKAARNAGGVTYTLTDKGLDLAPMLIEMILWSAKHDAATAAEPEFVAAALQDRHGLAAAVTRQHTEPTGS
jgi:DNA-binding HxlR family transcriptional regulator